MLNLDPGKLLVIAVVAIILLGPDRLPQVARQVGGAWRSFNEFRHRMEIRGAQHHARPALRPRRSPGWPARPRRCSTTSRTCRRTTRSGDGGRLRQRRRHGRPAAERETARVRRVDDAATVSRLRPTARPSASRRRERRRRPRRGAAHRPAAPARHVDAASGPTPPTIDAALRSPPDVVVPGDPTLN